MSSKSNRNKTAIIGVSISRFWKRVILMSKTVITYFTVFGFRNTTHLTAKSLTVSSVWYTHHCGHVPRTLRHT